MAAAASAGTGAGQNLAGVGMNVNLAPVLDVYYKSGNFIDQYQRSYSSSPSVASECGQAFVTAQQAAGVAATAKHFPGLGDLRIGGLGRSRSRARWVNYFQSCKTPSPPGCTASTRPAITTAISRPNVRRGIRESRPVPPENA